MNKNNMKIVISLVIGLSIGFCAGYMAGSHSDGSGEILSETQTPSLESVQESETVSSVIQTAEDEEAQETMGVFSYDQEPVLTIGGTIIYLDEINARVYMARDQYVSLYGEEPWNLTMEDGQSVGAYAKDTLLEEMQRITILCDKAGQYEGLALTEEEKADCERLTEDYMAALGTDVAAQFSVTGEAMLGIYEKDALSMKVYNRILEELTETLRSQEWYTDMSEDAFETVLMEKFEEQYQQWQTEYEILTTETWDQLVIGAVG